MFFLIFQSFFLFSSQPPLLTASPIEVSSTYDNGYPEQRYDAVIQIVKKVYSPVIEKLGGELKIINDWGDGAVNAWAFRLGHEYWLELPGGMARYHLINEEAFILNICHELGHMLGGAPQSYDISYEGQADYFATASCIGRLLSETQPIKDLPLNKETQVACQLLIKKKQICERSLKGALSLTSYYAEIANQPFPKISTPSLKQVNQTESKHSSAQCRLDTFVAGYIKGQRPRCWFAP